MRKTGHKTLKRHNKAGNRFLENKVHIASMYNGAHRDVTNNVLRSYAASRIQKSGRTRINKVNFETRLPNFYNKLVRFMIVLRRLNPEPAILSAIKDDILRTIPDRTVSGFLRLPNLYEKINLLVNLLSNHFPPLTEIEKRTLIELVDSIINAMNVPLHARINVPILPYRQFRVYQTQTQAQTQAQGRKRRTLRKRRSKANKSK